MAAGYFAQRRGPIALPNRMNKRPRKNMRETPKMQSNLDITIPLHTTFRMHRQNATARLAYGYIGTCHKTVPSCIPFATTDVVNCLE